MAYKMNYKGFVKGTKHSPLNKVGPKDKKKVIKDDIRYMQGDSDSDSNVPYDVDIINQHQYNQEPGSDIDDDEDDAPNKGELKNIKRFHHDEREV